MIPAGGLDLGIPLTISSRLLVDSSRCLVLVSRQRADLGRRLVGRRRLICGGSDLEFREAVRRRLLEGVLAIATWRCWPAARATGAPCLVCDAPIVEPDIDYQIAGPRRGHAHLACYNLWVEESAALRVAAHAVSKSASGKVRRAPQP